MIKYAVPTAVAFALSFSALPAAAQPIQASVDGSCSPVVTNVDVIDLGHGDTIITVTCESDHDDTIPAESEPAEKLDFDPRQDGLVIIESIADDLLDAVAPETRATNCSAESNLEATANAYIGKCRKASIRREFASQYLEWTLGKIKGDRSKAGKKAWKLLNKLEYKK